MAKTKKSSARPQAKHPTRNTKSRHDKRQRLQTANPDRQRTTRAKFALTGRLAAWVASLQEVLDPRMAFRLSIVVAGMLLAEGRRTASRWFVAAGVRDDWDRFYDALISVGQRAAQVRAVVLELLVKRFASSLTVGESGKVLLAIDDTPEERYGPQVEGAGVHHDPTPGPAGNEWLYGHSWVTLAWLQRHPLWGVIALAVGSLLYVRQREVAKLDAKRGWQFRTKLTLAAELLAQAVTKLRQLGVTASVWLTVDGAYARRKFLLAARKLSVTVVSRLRKDARLFDVPQPPPKRGRGRPRIYGVNRLWLRRRAGQPGGWQSLTYSCRGVEVTRDVKSFLATSPLVSGTILVVILRFADGSWAPYFCTDITASVREVVEAVAARWALEEHFHDVKEVWGAGQQQVRNVWSNIGCWNLNQWLYTLVELCSWDAPKSSLTDRRDRPWDNADRRPSHADRRRAISREMLEKELSAVLSQPPDPSQFRRLLDNLLALAT